MHKKGYLLAFSSQILTPTITRVM